MVTAGPAPAVLTRAYGPRVPALLKTFPPRPAQQAWPATAQSREEVLQRLLAPPFAAGSPSYQPHCRAGLARVLAWLESCPGRSWQERWIASGADAAGNIAWRELCRPPRAAAGRQPRPGYESLSAGRGIAALISGDVIRPSLSWLTAPHTPKKLAAQMARARDAAGFTALKSLCAAGQVSATAESTALSRIAVIMAAKGGLVADVTVGDCLELAGLLITSDGYSNTSLYYYQMLHALGAFPASAPATVRIFGAPGQRSIEQVIDGYGIQCRPVRDLLVDYLRERQASIDHSTMRSLARQLGKLFWRDLELHHPGISSLHLEPAAAAAWKQRIMTRQAPAAAGPGQAGGTRLPRHDAISHLATVRAFYLDIGEWAMDDPARWGPWAAPCPVRAEDVSRKKSLSRRKSRMDARTRERMPVLPALAAAVARARDTAAARLDAAAAAGPGQAFTFAGQELLRPPAGRYPRKRVWAQDPATGKHRNLTLEEHHAFWAWATVEVLRHTGIRIEELTELSHHSLIQYRLPATGELIPLLQIAPSKTDAERLLVISPELADVLSMVVSRVRGPSGAIPLVTSYDPHERVWNPPMPLLFQRRHGMENRAINAQAIRALLNGALAGTSHAGRPPKFTPHDFRRIFVTDAVMNGMPPHIAQLICGHASINTTMGYKAVYPEEVITGHRAFLARRRATRPGEEYRTPTDAEWDEFLGHFERRKVALGDCGRAWGTSCIHEHSCVRCPLLRVDPAQHARLAGIHDNLTARITEAEREGWAGEAEGLKISLAAASSKLTQARTAIARRRQAVSLGMPAYPDAAGRTITSPAQIPAP
jgi:integrase